MPFTAGRRFWICERQGKKVDRKASRTAAQV